MASFGGDGAADDLENGADGAIRLVDWRRRVADLYRRGRASPASETSWHAWRDGRDELFKTHAASPIPPAERHRFAGLPYFAYDPGARVTAVVSDAPHERIGIGGSHGTFGATRFAHAGFELAGALLGLDLYWLDGYGGGLFLPFRDATSGRSSYGAGRYLLDTVKGADLGTESGDGLVLDFNFAYHPSCAYDPRWACPLAPPANHLTVAVEAGERLPM
jgi:uncharacterized protein